MGMESKVYSHSEVSTHNTSEDCWVIINAKVYNVTSYLNEHPGGDEVLLTAAGKDASQEFEDVGHGSAARLMLDEFYVGEVNPSSIKPLVEGDTIGVAPSTNVKDKSSAETNSYKLLYFLISLAIIALGIGVHFNLSS